MARGEIELVAGYPEFSRMRAALAIVCAGLVCLASFGAPARAQDNGQAAGSGKADAINLGGRGWSVPQAAPVAPAADQAFELSARAGVASDYMYRGVTLSAHKPAAGAGLEATFGLFYAGATVASVNLPTDPDAEFTLSAGLRPSLGKIDFDFGVTYFLYPGEAPGGPTGGIEYWEAAARADTTIGDSLRVAGGFAYSPNVSNTGAWSWYAAGGAAYTVPARLIPLDVGVSFSAAAGHSWFGTQSLALGGFPLPDYLNWHAGVTLSHKNMN